MISLFFSSVAHELRTPLNSIIPMSKTLKRFIHCEQGQKILEIIINSSIHLSFVVEDALDYSRIENNKFEITETEFDVEETIKEVISIMDFQAI